MSGGKAGNRGEYRQQLSLESTASLSEALQCDKPMLMCNIMTSWRLSIDAAMQELSDGKPTDATRSIWPDFHQRFLLAAAGFVIRLSL